MIVLDILPFIGGILSATLALAVFANGASPKELRVPFALFAGSVAVWAMAISLFRLTDSQALASTLVPLYYIAAIGIPYWLFTFSARYVGYELPRVIRWLAAIPALELIIMVLLPNGLIESVVIEGERVVQLSSAYVIYVVYFAVYALLALVILWQQALKSIKGHRHSLVLAASLTVCLLGGALFNLLLPGLGQYQLISLGPLFTFVMVTAVFYAIARQGLFDLRWAAVRTAAYILTLGTLSSFYLFVVFLVFDRLLDQSSTLNQTVLNVILTLSLALMYQPIKRFFDILTHRLFYKDSYNADEFYARLSKKLASTTDLVTLLERTATLLAETMRADQAHFFIYEDDEKVVSGGTDGYRKVPRKDFIEIANHSHGLIRLQIVTDVKIRRILISHRLGLVMPLRQNGRLVGYLCLGEHRAGAYTNRDVKVLQTVADELVIAIQNALSIQEVKDLNAHLEQRITSATRELRASNAQLHRLDEAKDEFISMASHQLRTPLTSIKGYISMMMEGDVGPISKEQKQVLQEAFLSSERMVRLIGDFLNVSRLQTGKFIIDRHPVDLATVVQNELDALTPSATARGLKFKYTAPKNLPQVAVDENKIQQVIMNFSDNAIYYSKEGSTIKVSLKKTGKWLEFAVKDTGIGVPVDEQAQLFHKFFRATNARQQRPDGTGVGLFLAKKVVDAHGGEIIFESKESKGSTFGFRLPID